MGWIVKTRSKWRFRFREAGRVRTVTMSATVQTKAQAQRCRRDWEGQIERFRNGSAKGTPWTLARCQREVEAVESYSPSQLKNHAHYWKAIRAFFGDSLPLQSITKPSIMEWIASLRDRPGRSGRIRNTTLRHYVFTLSHGLQLAVEHEVLDRNPCALINLAKTLPDDTRKRERRLTEGEFRRLLENTLSPHLYRYLLLAWGTGGRMGEILSLEWKDIDPAGGTVTFHHNPERGKRVKTKQDRTVHVSKDLLTALGGGTGWVFPSQTTGHLQSIKHALTLTAKRAGVEGVSSHVIRHTVGSIIAANVSMPAARDHLGHADLRVTSRYSHTADAEKQAAARVLSGMLIRHNACTDACTEASVLDTLRGSEEFASAWKRLASIVERETGLEPATLSLEGCQPDGEPAVIVLNIREFRWTKEQTKTAA